MVAPNTALAALGIVLNTGATWRTQVVVGMCLWIWPSPIGPVEFTHSLSQATRDGCQRAITGPNLQHTAKKTNPARGSLRAPADFVRIFAFCFWRLPSASLRHGPVAAPRRLGFGFGPRRLERLLAGAGCAEDPDCPPGRRGQGRGPTAAEPRRPARAAAAAAGGGGGLAGGCSGRGGAGRLAARQGRESFNIQWSREHKSPTTSSASHNFLCLPDMESRWVGWQVPSARSLAPAWAPTGAARSGRRRSPRMTWTRTLVRRGTKRTRPQKRANTCAFLGIYDRPQMDIMAETYQNSGVYIYIYMSMSMYIYIYSYTCMSCMYSGVQLCPRTW